MNEDPRVDRSESRPWWFSLAPPEPSPLFRLRRALLRLHLHVPHHSGVGRARLDPCRGTTLATPVSTYICGLTGITWCTGATAAGPTWTTSSIVTTTPSRAPSGRVWADHPWPCSTCGFGQLVASALGAADACKAGAVHRPHSGRSHGSLRCF